MTDPKKTRPTEDNHHGAGARTWPAEQQGADDAESFSRELGKYTLREKLSYAFTAGLCGASLVAGVLNPFAPVLLSGVCTSGLTVVMARNQRELVDLVVLRKVLGGLREEIGGLARENARLTAVLVSMRERAGRLEDLTRAMRKINGMGKQSIREFAQEVERMRASAERMEDVMEDTTMSFVLDAVVRFDANDNDVLERNEAKKTIKRLHNLYGIEIDVDELMEQMAEMNAPAPRVVSRGAVLFTAEAPTERRRPAASRWAAALVILPALFLSVLLLAVRYEARLPPPPPSPLRIVGRHDFRFRITSFRMPAPPRPSLTSAASAAYGWERLLPSFTARFVATADATGGAGGIATARDILLDFTDVSETRGAAGDTCASPVVLGRIDRRGTPP
eukprot:CAMPEP_0194286650 /NCGR_PEP_ID=MMETSP0169-20130528/32964_1 /TAXON_ID=218684 /ORGANISM="Corethron pennatum, Strain L29A3" /LENGTH=391 /DNA_ID=CAMNT_0039033137 /DNA_START=155 /DNA_END=1327 /DNA_ORIENTATION=-